MNLTETRRTTNAWILEAIFVVYLLMSGVAIGPFADDVSDTKTFSPGTAVKHSTFRHTAGNENTPSSGPKPANVAGCNSEISIIVNRYYQAISFRTAQQVSRYFCHVFYVFVSSQAP